MVFPRSGTWHSALLNTIQSDTAHPDPSAELSCPQADQYFLQNHTQDYMLEVVKDCAKPGFLIQKLKQKTTIGRIQ